MEKPVFENLTKISWFIEKKNIFLIEKRAN